MRKVLLPACQICYKGTELEVTEAQYTALETTQNIRAVFPKKPKAFHQLVATGLHPECVKIFFQY